MPRSPTRLLSLLLLALVALAALGCDQKVGPGVSCYTDDDCTGETGCFFLEGTNEVEVASESVCLAYCDPASTYCDDDEVCAPSGDSPTEFVCLVGGPIITGDQCGFSWQCEKGSVCVLAGVGSYYCHPSCDTALTSVCGIDRACVDIDPCDGRTLGYCTVDSPAEPVCPGADAGTPDAGTPDAGAPDAGTP